MSAVPRRRKRITNREPHLRRPGREGDVEADRAGPDHQDTALCGLGQTANGLSTGDISATIRRPHSRSARGAGVCPSLVRAPARALPGRRGRARVRLVGAAVRRGWRAHRNRNPFASVCAHVLPRLRGQVPPRQPRQAVAIRGVKRSWAEQGSRFSSPPCRTTRKTPAARSPSWRPARRPVCAYFLARLGYRPRCSSRVSRWHAGAGVPPTGCAAGMAREIRMIERLGVDIS